jgi:hypothetical protein
VIEIVRLWDLFRIQILLTTFTVLVLLRLYFHVTDSGESLIYLPKVYESEKRDSPEQERKVGHQVTEGSSSPAEKQGQTDQE